MTEPVDVVVAVRPQLVREALRSLLEGRGFSVVGTAGSLGETVTLARTCKPHVLLLDCEDAGTACLDALRELAQSAPSVRVLLLTGTGIAPPLPEVIFAGARGVVGQDVSPDLLARAIRSVAAGQYWVGRDCVVDVLHHVRQAERKRETRPTPAETLTPRERQIVRGISSGESNREMAERLGLSEGTIKAHVTAIYDKLGVSNRAELAAVAVTHHLADDPPNASAGSST